MVIDAVAHAGIAGYGILFAAVAASWIGIPIVGAGVLAAAGVLASDGEMSIWLVIAVASLAAEIGGYAGYLLGARAGDLLSDGRGPWPRQRRRAIVTGARVYRRWGRFGVFITPTFVSGALQMEQRAFLFWNALAALASTSVTAFGAYGVGAEFIV